MWLPLRRFLLTFCLVCCGLGSLLAACGGGGGSVVAAAPGVVGTGPAIISRGLITGFASIIVNGVEYDDSAATVTDEDDKPLASSDLRLGMVVEIRGQASDIAPTGRASTIRIVGTTRGTVQAVDAAAGVLRILGAAIRVTPQTVYERAAGLADLHVGDAVEVSGFYDRAGETLTATRIERLASLPAGSEKLRGVVAALNAQAKQFRLGSQVVLYDGAALKRLPDGLSNGLSVKVKGQVGSDGRLRATEVQGQKLDVEGAHKASLEGLVGDFASRADFQVDEQRVDASDAHFVNGRAGDLRNGVQVRVAGEVRRGVLVARTVEIRRPEAGPAEEFELKGPVARFVSLADFQVKGQRVDASAAILEGGLVLDLRNGLKVEVRGELVSTPTGAVLKARRLKIGG